VRRRRLRAGYLHEGARHPDGQPAPQAD